MNDGVLPRSVDPTISGVARGNSPTSVIAARQSVSEILGRAAFYGLVLLTLVVAIPFGTVDHWATGFFVSAVVILAALRVTSGMLADGFRVSSGSLLLPLVGIIALAFIQTIPIKSAGGLISLDPYQTKTFVLVFGSLTVSYEALLALTISNRRLKFLVGVVVAVALSSALYGIAREALSTTDWGIFREYSPGEQSYAQFLNRNHFAALGEMALGLLIGILLKAELSTKVRFAGASLAAVLAYSIIASSSRGGILSGAGLVLFAVFVHAITRARMKKRRSSLAEDKRGASHLNFKSAARATAVCLVVFALMVLVVAFVGGDRVVSRFEKIATETDATDASRVNRALIWNSTENLIWSDPILGTGFGAYEAAITKFDESNGQFRLSQAHNDYLELLASGGAVGFLLFALFAALVTVRIVRNLGSSSRFRRACCFGAAVGIFGVLLHALVDFGLHTIIDAYVLVLLLTIATAEVPETLRTVPSNTQPITG